MKSVLIFGGWLVAANLFAASTGEFRAQMERYLQLGERSHVVLYQTPRAFPSSDTSIIEQEELKVLFDLIPTTDLAADDPPRKSLMATVRGIAGASSSGVARWPSYRVSEFEEALHLAIQTPCVSDVLRGFSIPSQPTIRAESYVRRLGLRDYKPTAAQKEEDAIMANALRVVAAGGAHWPSRARIAIMDRLESAKVTTFPTPKRWRDDAGWQTVDFSGVVGLAVQKLQILRVRLIYQGLPEELLYERWWDATQEALLENGISYPISSGMLPNANSQGAIVPKDSLPWIPREAILFRPAQDDFRNRPLTPITHLNVSGPCVVGLICELMPKLPDFDEHHFTKK